MVLIRLMIFDLKQMMMIFKNIKILVETNGENDGSVDFTAN